MAGRFKFLEVHTSKPSPKPPALRTSILEAWEVSQYDREKKEKYMPADRLDELMTYDAVQEVISSGEMIKELSPEEQKDLTDFIIRDAKNLFAISIWSGLTADELVLAMATFYNKDFKDEHLPVPDPPLHEAFEGPPWGKHQPTTNHFCMNQWSFQVPVFKCEEMVYCLDEKVILPFKRIVGTGPKNGTFGQVFEVEIPKKHLDPAKFNVSSFPFSDSRC
jgi:hypothetical protein